MISQKNKLRCLSNFVSLSLVTGGLLALAGWLSATSSLAALAMLAIAGAMLLTRRRGLAAMVMSDGLAGAMARRLLPAAVLVPTLVVYLRLEAMPAESFPQAQGLALLSAGCLVVLLMGVIWWSLAALDRSEQARQQALDDLGRSQERFRLLVESSPNAIVMVGPDGRITLANQQAGPLFGYTPDELVGQTIEILVPARFRPHHPAYRAGFLHDPARRPMGAGRDLFAVRKDGVEVPVEIGLTPVRTAEGLFTMATVTDITARKHDEEQLKRTADELARSNQDLERFAYVASHDLQEPLRMITGHLDIVALHLKDRLDADTRQSMLYATQGAKRMQALIRDLLAFSRAGRAVQELAPTDMNMALAAARQNLKASIDEAGAAIESQPLPTLLADKMQMVQLLQNLLGNAIKYRSDDRPPRIRVTVIRQGAEWLLAVSDNGIGIAPEHWGRIFMVFQRVHARADMPGTGIGLAICKRIVEYHLGRIWVESVPGEGSTFFFTLPAGKH